MTPAFAAEHRPCILFALDATEHGLSDSEWSSDSGASNAEVIASSALNMHLVELVTSRHLSRVTHHRRGYTTAECARAASSETSQSTCAIGEAPSKPARIDVRSLIRAALSQSSEQCPSTNVNDVASQVAAALR
ncbi:hypothetical protein Q4I30_004270 [Leishmania utingensis]|uniref:Transcription elongation factor-like protein n=1 Tax=Leishmania utingensis TaxID=653362 RepID=A0AAW3AGS6_9TRYP